MPKKQKFPKYTPEKMQAMQALTGDTNEAFAARVPVTSRTWEMWKLGHRTPRPVYCRALAHLEAEIKAEKGE